MRKEQRSGQQSQQYKVLCSKEGKRGGGLVGIRDGGVSEGDERMEERRDGKWMDRGLEGLGEMR